MKFKGGLLLLHAITAIRGFKTKSKAKDLVLLLKGLFPDCRSFFFIFLWNWDQFEDVRLVQSLLSHVNRPADNRPLGESHDDSGAQFISQGVMHHKNAARSNQKHQAQSLF